MEKVLRPRIAANNSINFLGRRKGGVSSDLPRLKLGWNKGTLISSPDHNLCNDGPSRRTFRSLLRKRLPKERHLFAQSSANSNRDVILQQFSCPTRRSSPVWSSLYLCVAKALRRQPHSADTVSPNHQYNLLAKSGELKSNPGPLPLWALSVLELRH